MTFLNNKMEILNKKYKENKLKKPMNVILNTNSYFKISKNIYEKVCSSGIKKNN